MEALSKLNFRDIGGIRVKDGTLRRGVIYRSEGPASFEADHRAELKNLGIRVVCDLRSEFEQQAAPNDWADDARLLSFDIIADVRAQSDAAWSPLRSNPTAEGARETMANNYRAMPAAIAPHLPNLVSALEARETPVLVHCTAGKDRTGVMVALLLALLGASEHDIFRDYLLSETFGQQPGRNAIARDHYEKSLGFVPDEAVVQAFVGVDPSYLQAALDVLPEKWGSTDNYFAAAGIDAARRAALVAALVERDGSAERRG